MEKKPAAYRSAHTRYMRAAGAIARKCEKLLCGASVKIPKVMHTELVGIIVDGCEKMRLKGRKTK